MCMSNAEFTREGQRNLREALDWVREIGCDGVTMASSSCFRSYPILIQFSFLGELSETDSSPNHQPKVLAATNSYPVARICSS
jgi:hypothetical protein